MSADFYPRPRKALGQHFLTDPRILGRIADALASAAGDTVVEIGPGRGALTDILLSRQLRVVAIEVDRDLAPMLERRHAGNPRLAVIPQDVLTVDLAAAAGVSPYLVVGNVPYNITTPILFHALSRPRAARAVYLVQKEVAERVVARAGDEAYGALTANVQVVAKPELLFTVPAGAFIPPPKVESSTRRPAGRWPGPQISANAYSRCVTRPGGNASTGARPRCGRCGCGREARRSDDRRNDGQ